MAELGISYFSSDLEIAISLNVADVRAMDFVMGLQVYRVFVNCTKATTITMDRIYMFQRWRFPAKRALSGCLCSSRVNASQQNDQTQAQSCSTPHPCCAAFQLPHVSSVILSFFSCQLLFRARRT